jgi:hypothetical protein
VSLNFALSHCQRCFNQLPERVWADGGAGSCPSCGNATFGFVFPALHNAHTPATRAEAIASDEEASCFYHSQKRAAVTCDSCGRFLCGLCQIDWGGKNLCAPCVQTGNQKRNGGNLESRRTMWDSIALASATLPLLIFYFTIFTAPLTLFLVIRYWRAPSSLIPRTPIRMYAALAISVFEIVGWVWLVAYFIMISRR